MDQSIDMQDQSIGYVKKLKNNEDQSIDVGDTIDWLKTNFKKK